MSSTQTQQQQKGIDVMSMRHLTFGGGGGKGMANVGVLLALEQLGLLPVKIDIVNGQNQANNKILGVSGASAGAFTSFCIALGYP
jgi:predicted acylesterase/phospholipase RssA